MVRQARPVRFLRASPAALWVLSSRKNDETFKLLGERLWWPDSCLSGPKSAQNARTIAIDARP